MGVKNRNSRVALGMSAFGFLLFVISYFTPYWLISNGRLKNPEFSNIGLWVACFNNFQDIHRFYDKRFNGCMWVYDEDFYIIHDFLLPGFYITVQFFCTFCFVVCIVAFLFTLLLLRTSRDDDRYVPFLITIGISQIFGFIFGFIAMVTWAYNGDRRDWMPGWQTNDMGWSYAFGCIGVIFLLPGGVLYLVEARRERYKHLNEEINRDVEEYTRDEYAAAYPQQQVDTYFAPEPSRPRRPVPGQRLSPSEPSTSSAAATAIMSGGIQTDI